MPTALKTKFDNNEEIVRYWGQSVTKKGKIWETHIIKSRIRPKQQVKVGLNGYLLKSALTDKAILKVYVLDKDVWFQVPAWRWHAHSYCFDDFDYQPARFISRGVVMRKGKPYLPIYLYPIPEEAFKRKND